jgi:hypothetical protein
VSTSILDALADDVAFPRDGSNDFSFPAEAGARCRYLEYRPFGSAFKYHRARSLLMAIADLAPKFAFVFLMAIAPLAALVMPALVSANPAARCLRALFKPASQPNICRPLDADHLP